MAASENHSSNTNENGISTNNNKGGCAAVPENSGVGPSERGLKHKIRISVNWTRDEQSLLEELLAKYASDSRVLRFSKIAKQLHDKAVREVAIRCRWMTNKENGKRRKEDNISSSKKKEKRVRIADQQVKPSSHATNRRNGLLNGQSPVSMDSYGGISYKAIGGASGQLLEQNAHALDQISANFSAFKVHENIGLFRQIRNNIVAILNNLDNMPEIMKQMPPLPVKLNNELANSILPQ